MGRISVLIPTFRRPNGFLRAARSVLAQSEAAQIIGLDNAPEHSARAAFALFAAEAGDRFVQGHERRAGVAHARNAALALADGDLLAWLDDDEEAAAGWLAALVRVQRETRADVVFGPVLASTTAASTPQQRAYFERLYTRSGSADSGIVARAYGIGNSLIVRGALPREAPFDARANETGGEDDLLFAAMRAANKRFAWSPGAVVTEHVETSRLTFAYAMKRAFAYGQGPCETAAAERDIAAVARHMIVGAAQSAAFAAAAAAAYAVRAPNRWICATAPLAVSAKSFWFRPQKFYGPAA